MSMNVVAVEADSDVRDAVRAFSQHAIRRLPVIDGDETVAPTVLIRTRPGNSISRSSGPSSFQIDEIDLAARRAVSVLVRGRLVKAARWTGLPDTYPWVTGERDDWLALEIETIAGRRFVGRSEGAGDTAFDILDVAAPWCLRPSRGCEGGPTRAAGSDGGADSSGGLGRRGSPGRRAAGSLPDRPPANSVRRSRRLDFVASMGRKAVQKRGVLSGGPDQIGQPRAVADRRLLVGER